MAARSKASKASTASEQVDLLKAIRDALTGGLVELQTGSERTTHRLAEAVAGLARVTAELESLRTRLEPHGSAGNGSTAEPAVALPPSAIGDLSDRLHELETQLRELREGLLADRIHFKLRVDRLERHSGLVPTD